MTFLVDYDGKGLSLVGELEKDRGHERKRLLVMGAWDLLARR